MPDHVFIKVIVHLTPLYLELVSDMSNPGLWMKLKHFITERCQLFKLTDYYPLLYDSPENSARLFIQFFSIVGVHHELKELASKSGFGDILDQPLEAIDPGRFQAFSELILEECVPDSSEALDPFFDWDDSETHCKNYWENTFPKLSDEEKQNEIRNIQIFFCMFSFVLHNAIAVISYGETLSSLVQKALASGSDADDAMCKAARVDNNLRQHPKFIERIQRASKESDSTFIRHFYEATPPITHKIQFPGLYLLFSLLDSFGLLDRLTDNQLLDLSWHAGLDRWEKRIEDVKNLSKRRKYYEEHKLILQSTPSN